MIGSKESKSAIISLNLCLRRSFRGTTALSPVFASFTQPHRRPYLGTFASGGPFGLQAAKERMERKGSTQLSPGRAAGGNGSAKMESRGARAVG